MQFIKLIFSFIFLTFISCKTEIETNSIQPVSTPSQEEVITTFPSEIGGIPLPEGFTRLSNTSFSKYLLGLPLKPKGSKVKLHNGDEKWNQEVHYAIINLPIGKRDLHQCADAVMRVRADYLRKEERFDDIHFNFTNGFNCTYSKWIDGYRIRVNGNNVNWIKTESFGDTDANYWKYLEMVWSYAGTLSLEKELVKKDPTAIEAGDVWIKGGSPGHAIMVMDVSQNADGEKIFLLAQSYMPAQEMHVLVNPKDEDLSPWYRIPDGDLVTPEWTFSNDQLRTWDN